MEKRIAMRGRRRKEVQRSRYEVFNVKLLFLSVLLISFHYCA